MKNTGVWLLTSTCMQAHKHAHTNTHRHTGKEAERIKIKYIFAYTYIYLLVLPLFMSSFLWGPMYCHFLITLQHCPILLPCALVALKEVCGLNITVLCHLLQSKISQIWLVCYIFWMSITLFLLIKTHLCCRMPEVLGRFCFVCSCQYFECWMCHSAASFSSLLLCLPQFFAVVLLCGLYCFGRHLCSSGLVVVQPPEVLALCRCATTSWFLSFLTRNQLLTLLSQSALYVTSRFYCFYHFPFFLVFWACVLAWIFVFILFEVCRGP